MLVKDAIEIVRNIGSNHYTDEEKIKAIRCVYGGMGTPLKREKALDVIAFLIKYSRNRSCYESVYTKNH